MNRNELHELLKAPYKKGMDCGITKIEDPAWENIYFVVPPTPPTELKESLPLKSLATSNKTLNNLPQYENMDELDKIINYLIVRNEAVRSSRMEGTWSTIDQVLTPKELILENGREQGFNSVKGYAKALEEEFDHAFKKKEAIFNESLIRTLHQKIMREDPSYKGTPGEFRIPGKEGSIVTIGGSFKKENSIYNPTPPEYVNQCLKKVLKWYSDEELAQKGDAGLGMSLPIRMAIGHSHFEAVHPFRDGNGRVGRALLPLQIVSTGSIPLFLSGFFEKEKSSYSEALQSAQKKLVYSPLIDFFSAAIIESAKEYYEIKSSLKILPQIWEKKCGFRKKSAGYRSLDLLISNPIFSVDHFKNLLGCSFQAANNAISTLLELGIIRERTKKGRYRIFAAEEVISIITRGY